MGKEEVRSEIAYLGRQLENIEANIVRLKDARKNLKREIKVLYKGLIKG